MENFIPVLIFLFLQATLIAYLSISIKKRAKVERGLREKVDNYVLLNEEYIELNEEYQNTNEKLRNTNIDLTEAKEQLNIHIEELTLKKEQLKESEQKYRQLFNNLSVGFGMYELVFNDDGEPVDCIIRDANSQLLEAHSLSLDDAINKRGSQVFKFSICNWQDKFANIALAGGVGKSLEYVPLLDRYYELHAYSPKPDFFAVIYNDITENEKAKQALLAQKNRIEGILKGTDAGTWDWNIKSSAFVVNARWAQMVGYTLEELEPTADAKIFEFIAPQDQELVKETVGRVFAKELDYFDMEFRQKHKNGHLIWVHSRGSIVEWDEDGQPLRMMGTYLDVTDKKEAAMALEESEKRFKTIFEKSKAAMYIVDPETTKIVDINDTAAKFYGYDREMLIGMSMDNINVLSRDEIAHKMGLARKEDKSIFKFQHKLASGRIRNVDVIASPITVNKKEFLHTIAIDTTNAVRAKYRIKQINKRFEGLDNIINYKASSINDLLDFTLKQSIEFTESDFGTVYHCDSEKGIFYLNNWSQNVSLTHAYEAHRQDVDNMDCLNKAVKRKEAVIENNPRQYYPFQNPELLNGGFLKSITIPIIANNKVVALFWLAKQHKSYTGFHAEQLMLLLDTAWIMVEKQRMKG